MKTLKLGDSGLQVSELCLGVLQFGTRVDRETGFAILDAYYEAGGRFIDTANNYSLWHNNGKGTESETMLGEWITERGNREELIIASKVGFNRPDRGQSLSRESIEAEFEGSRKRLQTDWIDLYYAHADVRKDPLEETLATFDALVKTGKVRVLGCSNYRAWRIAEARALSEKNGWASYSCIQQRHTYLRPRPGASFGGQTSSNEDLLDYCREHPEMRLLAYSPLLNGAYTREDREIPAQYRGAETDARLAMLDRVCEETGSTRNQVIYAWLLAGSPKTIPLTAPTSLSQLEENLAALSVKLSPEQIEGLSTAGNP